MNPQIGLESPRPSFENPPKRLLAIARDVLTDFLTPGGGFINIDMLKILHTFFQNVIYVHPVQSVVKVWD